MSELMSHIRPYWRSYRSAHWLARVGAPLFLVGSIALGSVTYIKDITSTMKPMILLDIERAEEIIAAEIRNGKRGEFPLGEVQGYQRYIDERVRRDEYREASESYRTALSRYQTCETFQKPLFWVTALGMAMSFLGSDLTERRRRQQSLESVTQ